MATTTTARPQSTTPIRGHSLPGTAADATDLQGRICDACVYADKAWEKYCHNRLFFLHIASPDFVVLAAYLRWRHAAASLHTNNDFRSRRASFGPAA